MPVHRSSELAHATQGEEKALSSQYFTNPTPTVPAIPCVRDTDAQETSITWASSFSAPEIYFPTTALERAAYRTKLGKAANFPSTAMPESDA